MLKKISAVLLALLLPVYALADLAWPTPETPGQEQLATYISHVNEYQALRSSAAINSLFELYPSFAVMGVTAQDMAEIPENVEMTFTLEQDSIGTLQLRSSQAELFTALAASCIQAASPSAITAEDAAAAVSTCMSRVKASPGNSFEDTVIPLPGVVPRVYYAYYPNQYHDGVDWLQMTLIFPMPGSTEAAPLTTPAPTAVPDEAYDGSDFDGGTHLEIFVTPTPEPDM